MKEKSKRYANRGSALVTVLIAVSFVTILSSTLIYMSYSNYTTKTVNGESKANFYGTEQGITRLSTTLRNKTTGISSPETELRTQLGVNPTSNRYSAIQLAKLAFPTAAVDPASTSEKTIVSLLEDGKTVTYTFSSKEAIDTQNFVTATDDGVTTVTIKSIELTRNTNDSFTNTIVTDIVFKYKQIEEGVAGGGVGTFSIISDGGTTIDSSEYPTGMNIYGNAYVGCGAGSKVAISADATGNETLINFFGDYVIVYGDIVLGGDSVLNIVGTNVLVCGNVILKDNASLMCSGTLRFPDCVDDRPGAPATDWHYGIIKADTASVYPSSLMTSTQKITAENFTGVKNLLKYGVDGETPGLVPRILSEASDVDGNGINAEYTDMVDPSSKEYFSTNLELDNGNYQVLFYDKEDDLNTEYVNKKLLFICQDGVKVGDGTNKPAECTILSKYKVKFAGERAYDLTCLGEGRYRALCDIEMEALGSGEENGYFFRIGDFVAGGDNITEKLIKYSMNVDPAAPEDPDDPNPNPGAGGSVAALYYDRWKKE